MKNYQVRTVTDVCQLQWSVWGKVVLAVRVPVSLPPLLLFSFLSFT